MATIRCKACGRSYRYETEGCCPGCGAYNRPPKHERVNADGTVQHMTDAAYEKRKKAQEKVCFEEKECYEEKVCYEDQARHSSHAHTVRTTSSAFNIPAASARAKKQTTGKSRSFLSIVIIIVTMLGAIISLAGNLFDRHNSEPEVTPAVPVIEEPDITWADAVMGEPLKTEDGSVITVTSWGITDDQINVYLDMDLEDSDHDFYAALLCVGQDGEEIYLTDFATEETDMGTCLQFIADQEDAEPAYLELEEHLEDETLQILYVDLQS